MKKHILVIDDETTVVQVLGRLLVHASYKVTVALDGKEGIKLYREDPADLVIVDIFMPRINGLEVIRTLKREYPDARFIAISGGASRGEADPLPRAKEMGADFAFAKPVDTDELLKAIEELLNLQE